MRIIRDFYLFFDLKKKHNFCCCRILVCLGAAAAGTGLAWTSPVLDQLKADNSTIPTRDEQATWIASMLAIGAICGALPCGILADIVGRKKAALIIAVPYIISYVLTVFATNVFTLFVARFLIGKFKTVHRNHFNKFL